MFRHGKLDNAAWRADWRMCVCVLVVGLLLYNPFLALHSSSDALSLHAPARHRATVGSGELQHFSPVSKAFSPDLPLAEIAIQSLPEISQVPSHFIDVPVSVFPVQAELPASLWFRPPPSA